MDKFKIDSHKLIYHVDRVNDWLHGVNIYPVYMEISPVGICNHRCTYCAVDFVGYQNRALDKEILKERLSEMASLGIRGIMYAGEGEPLLHKNISEIVQFTKKVGIDVAITTNGVLLKGEVADSLIGNATWIKVSMDAATRETYSKIHRTKPDDFDRVIKNISDAVKIRKERGYRCTIGLQLLLLPENLNEVIPLANTAKAIGVDYLVVKPYSQHPLSHTTEYKEIRYDQYLYLAEGLQGLNSSEFHVIFRMNTMKKWDENGRNYQHCLALPFWCYIDAGGTVWGCSAYLTDKRFNYGNICENTFEEIWGGKTRLQSLLWAEEGLDTGQCRVNCRMDEVNRYLWELRNPPGHVNFI